MKGRYKPINPNKYQGDPTNIVYRSSWELKFMRFCDLRDDVVQWQSEEIIVPYKSPIDGRYHRYFPDFLIKVRKKDGKEEVIMIEVKPYYQTQEPKKTDTGKLTKRYINEVKTYAINKYKWDAAIEYCKDRRWSFKILTENELGLK